MSPARAGRRTMHPLRVSDVTRLTDDALTLTFEVPADLRELYAFAPGQHVALQRVHGPDDPMRRSYSVCSAAGGPLRVAVKRLPGGVFSGYVHEQLTAGDELLVLPPSGRFTVDVDPGRAGSYAAIAAGSGITPILSIIASVLAGEPASRVTLVYGNRSTASIMFAEELSDLKDRYAERLALLHVLSREPVELELAAGRIDAPKLRRLFETLLPAESVDTWFVCGPLSMTETVAAALADAGVAPGAIRRELFHAEDPPAHGSAGGGVFAEGEGEGAAVEVLLDGRRTTLTVPHDGPPVLEMLLRTRPDAPYACKGGVCGTCRCRLTEGEVRMDHRYALEDDEVAADVVLACQAHPVSERVALDFDRG